MKQQQHDAFVGSKYFISVIIMNSDLINIILTWKKYCDGGVDLIVCV